MPHVLEIFALFMFLGIFTTMLIPETARKTLEELNGEEGVNRPFEEEDRGVKETESPEPELKH